MWPSGILPPCLEKLGNFELVAYLLNVVIEVCCNQIKIKLGESMYLHNAYYHNVVIFSV